MKFHYSGVDKASNQRVEGDIEALTEQEAVRLLGEQKIDVFSLTTLDNSKKKGRRVKKDDLVLPLQELSTLSSSGVVLIDAIRALAQNKEHIELSKGFSNIALHIEGGGSFFDAISKSSLPFPDYVAQLVKAGELGGNLAEALLSASEQMSYDQAVKNDVKSALTYPMVLIGSGIAAMLIIFFAVVPKFSHLLNDDKPLPLLAYWVLSAGKMANDSPWLIFGTIGGVILVLVAVFSNKTVKRISMDMLIQAPVIGPWLEEQDAAKWSSLSAAMLSTKVSLINALTLAASSCDYTKRRQRAMNMISDIESGVTFSDALARARLVPSTSLNLVAVGDKTGQLAKMLTAVARLHDQSCKRRMKQVLTLMEPLAILIVGVLIGVMILGIVLAITASTDIAI
ncbi:type II secretion system F family protein [Alteromonas sp. 5E99-2]|uniref:type II secretion system F family protein n=1 Tax=Alteromonas sp. 5E99-2 TaxID=2817683 RepID=UPI001A9A0940|nr:type II secretion system F family protein [Alteromonas sp. 5E99-2]MBO1254142.1 type II secretion system F family protein [Alteromonas sp. 5E99-2]